MEKKINNFIKRIEISENPLDKLNELIEEKCVNSSVLIICDFLTIKHNQDKLEKLKQSSINNIIIKVINSCELNKKSENKISLILNETYDLIVGIGEYTLLKFVQKFAIKTNISYAFVNLFNLKSEIFSNNLTSFIENNKFFPPFFVLIKNYKYTNEEIFNAKLNIFKYYYLFFEYNVNILKMENVKNFLLEYKNILSSLNNDNIINSLISLGLILNKFKIHFFINSNFYINEFNAFLNSTVLILIYQTIFSKITSNNLYFSRIYKNGIEEIEKFENFDLDFNKFYLLSVKNNAIKIAKNLRLCFVNFCDNLKNTSIESFYKNSRYINSNEILESVKNNKDELFLKFLENFEIFNF